MFQVVGSEERKRTLTPLALRERYSVLNEPCLGESRRASASVCCTAPLPTILSCLFNLARMAQSLNLGCIMLLSVSILTGASNLNSRAASPV